MHEKVCSNMKMGDLDPFSRLDPLGTPTTIEESTNKVLPQSQPLNPTVEEDIISHVPPTQTGTQDYQRDEQTGANTRDNCNCPICKVAVREEKNSRRSSMC